MPEIRVTFNEKKHSDCTVSSESCSYGLVYERMNKKQREMTRPTIIWTDEPGITKITADDKRNSARRDKCAKSASTSKHQHHKSSKETIIVADKTEKQQRLTPEKFKQLPVPKLALVSTIHPTKRAVKKR